MKLYIAADSTNPDLEGIVEALLEAGAAIYDPTRPHPLEHLDAGASPHDHAIQTVSWPIGLSPREIRDTLNDPGVVREYRLNLEAIRWADAVLALYPSNEGTFLSAGLAKGLGKPVYAWMPDGDGDTWLAMYDRVLVNETELAELVPDLHRRADAGSDIKSRLMADDD